MQPLTATSPPLETPDVAPAPSAVPWFVWCTVVAVTSAIVGGHWDISWHRSIGRDTFWTPPHIAIYLCGILAGVASAHLILSTTFGRERALAPSSVLMWGFRGPLGAFVAAWGGVAMLTSAPFDDWWHGAYGLDVKVLSPPHTLLALGIFAVQLGALLLVIGYMNRAEGRLKQRLTRIVLYVGAMMVVMITTVLIERTNRTYMHSAEFYRDVALALPLVLVGISRAVPHRWACTIMAAVYSAFLLGLLWILPLFAAEPKLGPVYHKVTHFVPPEFPLLLIVPALALDLLRRVSGRWGVWRETAATGTLFLATFAIVQWPFANFLQSPWARNRVFGSHYAGYYENPAGFHHNFQFWPAGTPAHFFTVMASALVLALIMSRLGVGLGDFLKRVRR
jgi:hypothetical protein